MLDRKALIAARMETTCYTGCQKQKNGERKCGGRRACSRRVDGPEPRPTFSSNDDAATPGGPSSPSLQTSPYLRAGRERLRRCANLPYATAQFPSPR